LEEQLFQALVRFRQGDSFSSVTVLTPNFHLARHLRFTAVERLGSLFNVRFSTLKHLLMDSIEPIWVSQGRRNLTGPLAPWALKGSAGNLLASSDLFAPLLETPGFYRAFSSLLSECRQAGYDPLALRQVVRQAERDKEKSGWARKVSVYADVLEAFSAWKQKENWFDGDDLYEEALRQKKGFPEAGLVLFYGFYDATVLQERVLQKMEGGDSIWYVPYLDTPAFEYAKPFFQRLSDRAATVHGFPKSVVPFPESLPFHLFASDPQNPPVFFGKDAATFKSSPLKVLLCPGERREARELARTARSEASRLDLDYSHCAVLLRLSDEYHSAITGEMDAQGLPYESRIAVSLCETLQGKAFLRLSETLLGGFGRSSVMDFLSSPGLDPASFLTEGKGWSPALWDAISKEASVVAGRDQWRKRILRWMDEQNSRTTREEGSPQIVEAAARLLQVLEPLEKAEKAIEGARDWGRALSVLEGLVRRHFTAGEERDRLADLLSSSAWVADLSKGLSKSDFTQVLRSLVDDETAPHLGSTEGGVQILDLMQSRGVPHDVVMIPGLVERSVPRPPRPDPFLLDGEREELNALDVGNGRHLALKRDGAKEERLLFALAAFSARKALILSAPVLDPQKGVPRVPSLFLYEILRSATGLRPDDLEDLSGLVRNVKIGDWMFSDPLEAADEMETAFSVTALARKGIRSPALGYLKRHPLGIGGFQAALAREGTRRFSAYEGMLSERVVKKENAALSPSRVECYAKCPQMYFYRYVLGLSVVSEPEEALEADVMETGNLMHHVMEKTVVRGLQEGWLKARDEEKALEAVREETTLALKKFEAQDVTGAECLWAWQKTSLREDLENAIGKIIADDEWLPKEVERSVAGLGALDAGGGLLLELKGRADRFDVSEDGKKFRVVDYKSGSSTDYAKNTLRGGRRIQLAMYLWAGRNLFSTLLPDSGVYEFLTAKGNYKHVVLEVQDWAEMEKVLRLLLSESQEGISKGVFPPCPAPHACAHCDYWTLCGSGMERRAERKESDPAIEGLLKMREVP
jgi:RecB family exonuclease